MSLLSEAKVSTALVEQKNALIGGINSVTSIDQLDILSKILDFVTPLWVACDYGYKVRELRSRIRAVAKTLLGYEDYEDTISIYD